MAKLVDVKKVESSSEKKIRIFLAVMYFLQVLMSAAFPLMYGVANDKGQYAVLTAVNLLIQPSGYNSSEKLVMAAYGAVLVIFPIVAFFFFVLDKKSKIKYTISYITCVLCAIIICFGPGSSIAYGGIFTLLLIIVIMFMTTQGFMATKIRENKESEEE